MLDETPCGGGRSMEAQKLAHPFLIHLSKRYFAAQARSDTLTGLKN
jgi:hypothetical protein